METGERLSAYLAGDLDAEQTQALEAELASDPSLRAQLERIRRADEALASLPPVTPSADFSAQLRETLRGEIERTTSAAPQVDELAQRRLQRSTRTSRFVGVGVAAAAVAAVAAIGLTSLLGDDAATSDPMGTMAAPEAAAGDPLAAFVQITDTDYRAEDIQTLAEERGVQALGDRLSEDEVAAIEAERAPVFGFGAAGDASAGMRAESEPGAQGGATGGQDGVAGTEDTAEPAQEPQALRQAGEPLDDVRRCLPEILSSASQPVIPLYAEVASFEGEPAIIYVLLTREPGARSFNRVEAWVVARDDCFPLHFQQVKR